MITQLVSDSIINSCSDYQQELNNMSQEKTGSELPDLLKLEIMEMMKTPEIENYQSSNTHGLPMVCKYNLLPTILKLPTTMFTIQLKSQMHSINNGTMFTIHTLMLISLPPEELKPHLKKIGS
jgi:hypothetical protein